MKLVSCRKDFDSSISFGPIRVRDYPSQPPLAESLTANPTRMTAARPPEEDSGDGCLGRLAESLAGKTVCVLVHGYHTNIKNAISAYYDIEARVHAAGCLYDATIGFLWPGSWLYAGFLPSESRAVGAGADLASLLFNLSTKGVTVDVETHSLGARVALEAISTGMRCRNLILTAPAVDDNCLGVAGEFSSIPLRARVAVFYSGRDNVLKYAYRIANGRVALGLNGTALPVPKGVAAFDFTSQIESHTAYKDCVNLYVMWKGLSS